MPSESDNDVRDEKDQQILIADALQRRVKNASLGETVEWLTAFAMCFRRAVVDGALPEPDVARIAKELVEGIDKGLPERLEGEDAEERRKEHRRVEIFMGAMKPAHVADLLDELAEGYREVLLYHTADRLARCYRSLAGDIALAGSPVVHDLVRLDRLGELDFEMVEEDRKLMADCASSAAS